MPSIVSPSVPSIGPLNAITDPAVRRAIQALTDAHNVRNGTTDERFVTYAELREATTSNTITVIGAPVTATKVATGKFVKVAIGNEVAHLQLFGDA